MGTRWLTLLLMCLLDWTSAQNGTTAELKPNERFRRLIPYMTFYFAQQNYNSKPQFQQYQGPATVFPVSNNKLPQYQGNLVVPTTYLLRPRPQTSKQPLPQVYQPQSHIQQHTQTFVSDDGNSFDPLLNNDPYVNPLLHSYQQSQGQIKSYPTAPASKPPPPPPLSVEDRTAALIRLLTILQQARRLPQSTTTSNNNAQTLAQILNIIQQSNNLPIETQSSLLKFLTHIPQHYKQPQAISVSTGSPFTPKFYQTSKIPIAIYSTKVPQPITTPSPDIDILQNTAIPKLTSTATTSGIPKISTGYSVTLSTTPAPHIDQANDLQNYDYTPVNIPNVKVIPNGEDSNKRPSLTDADNLQPYEYASKDPGKSPSYYGGTTFTQSYPAPNSEGSTPGRPGVDYPTYSSIPQTSFSCKTQRYKGFFGDPETSCQVWHYCDLNGGQASFLCPNGTIFSQVGLTCDWWFNVRCASTEQLYVLNERLYKYILPVMPSFPEDFSGPLVDQYLTLKFQELEKKKKAKATTTTTSTTEAPSEQIER